MKNNDLLSKYEVDSFSNDEFPENDLDSKYGITSEKKNPSTFESIFGSALKQAKEAPEEIGESYTQLVPSLYEAAKTFGRHPLESIEDLEAGLLKGGRGVLDQLIPKEKQPTTGLWGEVFQPSPFAQEVYARPERGHQVLQGIGSYIPAMLGKPFAQALKAALLAKGMGENVFTAMGMFGVPHAVNKGVKFASDLEFKAPELAEKMIEKIGKENLEELGQNIAEKQGKSKLSPFLPKTQLPPKELKLNWEAAEGTATPIGRIVNDPVLALKFENKIANMEGSPAHDVMNETKRQITERGNEFFKHLAEKSNPEQTAQVGRAIIDNIKGLEKLTRQEMLSNYDKVDRIATNDNIQAQSKNYVEYAKKALDEIESDPRLLSHEDPKVLSVLREASEFSPEQEFSIKKTNILKGKFGELSREAYGKGDRRLGKIYGDLRDSLRTDITDAVEKSGNEDLKHAYNDAERFFKEEWLPFEDEDITRFTRHGADPDLFLQAFVKPGKLTDRGNLLKKVTTKLDPYSRDLFAHSFLSHALDDNGNINPLKFRTMWRGLGDSQREALFGDYVPLLEKHMRLIDMNPEALDNMRNAKTGARGVPELVKLGTAAMGGMLGHSPEAMAFQAILGYGAPKALTKVYSSAQTKLHTSEALRDRLIRTLIKQQTQTQSKVPKHLQLFKKSLEESRKKDVSEHIKEKLEKNQE